MARRGKNKSEPVYTPDNRSTTTRAQREREAASMRGLSSKARRVVGAYYALPPAIREEVKKFLASNG